MSVSQGQPVTIHQDPSPHKRPWEDIPRASAQPSHHISREQLHFDKHIIDRNEPRANHPGWVERPPKKRRSTKNQAPRDSEAHARGHEYQRADSYVPPRLPSFHDPSRPGPTMPTPDGSSYTPAMWRKEGGVFDRYAKMQEPMGLEVDETLPPPVTWTDRPREYPFPTRERASRPLPSPQSAHQQPSQHVQHYLPLRNGRDSSQPPPQQYQAPPPRPGSTGPPPPPPSNSSYQPSTQRIESIGAPRHEQESYEYRRESGGRPSPSMSESRTWGQPPAPPSYDQHNTAKRPEPLAYQPQPSYSRSPQPATSTQQPHSQYPDYSHPPAQSHPKLTIGGAKCAKCDASGKILRTFYEQLNEISTVFGHFGDYPEIHEEYTSRGHSHEDVPGFSEFHRINDLVREASILTSYMVHIAPLLKKKLKMGKGGHDAAVAHVESELVGLKRKMMNEMAVFHGDEAVSVSPVMDRQEERVQRFEAVVYGAEPRTAGFMGEAASRRAASLDTPPSSSQPQYASMAPPPVPQQSSPAAQERRNTIMLPSQPERQSSTSTIVVPYRPISPPTAFSAVEPASTRRSSTFNATLMLQSQTSNSNPTNNPNIPTFAVESPAQSTLEAKLKKLKERLEGEIGEVDNLTEEKKRLEERIKELEAMVEEEREKRRRETDVGMRDRKSFLDVLENVVALGRREGDTVVKREKRDRDDGEGGKKEDDGEADTDIGRLRREVERLRERNRVCESALEHIQRETRHLEETGCKMNESRRGIDLVLGRVLAGTEMPMQVGAVVALGAAITPTPNVLPNRAAAAVPNENAVPNVEAAAVPNENVAPAIGAPASPNADEAMVIDE